MNHFRGHQSLSFVRVVGVVLTTVVASFSSANAQPASVVQFTARNFVVDEAAGKVTVTVERTLGTGTDYATDVNYITGNGTAMEGTNYLPSFGTLSWGKGQICAKSFTVLISHNALSEAGNSFNVRLSQGPTAGPTGRLHNGNNYAASVTYHGGGMQIPAHAVFDNIREDWLGNLPAGVDFYLDRVPAPFGLFTNATVTIVNNDSNFDFVHSFHDVFSTNGSTYVVDSVNMTPQADTDYQLSYWRPIVTGLDASITMRFDFPRKTAAAHLKCSFASYNFGNGNYGYGSLWASPDEAHWYKLMDAPTPTGIAGYYDVSQQLTLNEQIVGSTSLWIQARLTSQGLPHMAQFLRRMSAEPDDGFVLKVAYEPLNGARINMPRQNWSAIQTNGATMTLLMETGTNYRIQTSTNLMDWTDLTNTLCDCAIAQFTDVTATNKSRRFYRAISP